MIKNTKILLVLIIGIIFPYFSQAQFNNNTSSPYSRYGLGDLQSYSHGRTTAMGGASIASRNSRQINLTNPAAYNSLDTLSFLFELGLKGGLSQYENDKASMNANDFNLNYFALNFRITSWMAAGFGLKPYSDIGYDVSVREDVKNSGKVLYKYFGTGTLSRAFFGLGVRPLPYLSLGANLNYMFGKLNRSSNVLFGVTHNYNIYRNEAIRFSDLGFDFGVQGIIPIDKHRRVNLGAVIEAKPTYSAYYSDFASKSVQVVINNNSYADVDTLSFKDEEKSSITLPLTIGGGISYVEDDKWEINLDYYHQQWSKAKFFGATNKLLTNSNRFALGAEWIPEKYSIRSFFKRMAYRAGFKYEQSYLSLGGEQINDFGITFGFGIPIYRSQSTMNLGVELGQKGTKKNNLMLEKYAKINLSVNLHDLWFIKRKFD